MYNDEMRLMEVSQVPPTHTTSFHAKTGTRLFPYFNTNNLWISLPASKVRDVGTAGLGSLFMHLVWWRRKRHRFPGCLFCAGCFFCF